MERSECMTAFLLLVFISAVHLSPDPKLIFGNKGGRVVFEKGEYALKGEYLLYRMDEDGDRLLLNCSQPDSPQPDGYDITCPRDSWGFILNNLTMSHSGDYREEIWKRGLSSPVGSIVYRLTVCVEGNVDSSKDSDVCVRNGRAVICEFDFALGNGSSLQLYEIDISNRVFEDYLDSYTLVLDTSSSLEPLVPLQRARLQVDANSSVVTLSEIMWSTRYPEIEVLCTMWRGGQCQRARQEWLRPTFQILASHENESVTLPCRVKQDVHWSTPTGDVRISSNKTRPQEVMYMLDGSQSGDYSLIIPSVSHQHAGWYRCGHSDFFMNAVFLSVCVEFSPVNVMFSHGESVFMDAYVNDSKYLCGVQWFRQKGLQPQMLIMESIVDTDVDLLDVNDVRMPEDLMGRVTVFNSSTSLNISNLTAENGGVYTWRVIEYHFVCYEGSICLVYKDPFGVHTPFYRAYGPLLGCVLLGLVAAVIWLKLRSRGGALSPGGQEMEMQDIGDEDVYDDVEEGLTPGGQEMEMQDIGDEVSDDVEEAEDSI